MTDVTEPNPAALPAVLLAVPAEAQAAWAARFAAWQWPVAGTAATAAAALVAAPAAQIVLLDVDLPGGALTAAGPCREQHGRPVVLLTGPVDGDLLDRTEPARPAGYVGRAADDASVRAALLVAWRRHRAAEDAAEARRILEHLDVGVLATDVAGVVTYLNPVAAALTGWEPAAAVGQDYTAVLQTTDPQTNRPVECQATRKPGQRGPGGPGQTVRLARRDGAARLVTVALSSPPRGGGRPGGLLFAFRPQDEAPAPPPAPAAAPPPAADPADHLEGVQRVLGEAFGRFHREIILARGEAALAGHHLTNPPAAGRHLEGLRQRLEDVNGWMRSLADFFAWQAIRPQDVDLHQLLAQMGEELRGLLGPRCRLTTQVGPGPGLVRADAAGLRRLVRAAVANAGQAMPAGGTVRVETARVTVGPDQPPPPGVRLLPGPYLVLQVSDTGVGLDDRARARLFEPFFTTRAAAGGQGLNLAAAYGLAEQCNGGVAVQSALGQGTTFRFYWPLAVAPARADQGTVLLLDEDRSARRQTHQALERAGYRVLAARYAGEALRHAARPDEPIGLAVVAVPLHHHPAREVLRELRQLDPDLPVLCVSALPEELLVHLGQLDRAVPFRRRPAAPEDLLRDVQRLRVDRRPQLTVP